MLPYSPSHALKDIAAHHACGRRGIAKLKAHGMVPFKIGRQWEAEHENYVAAVKAIAARKIASAQSPPPAERGASQPVEPPKPARKRLAAREMTRDQLMRRTWFTRAMCCAYLDCDPKTLERAIRSGRIIAHDAPGSRHPRFLREQVDAANKAQPIKQRQRRRKPKA